MDPQLVLPDMLSNESAVRAKQGRVLAWLERFFATGDDVARNGTTIGTGSGPWLATAYPRAASPVVVTPDADGRLTYFHPIEDQWGHAFRYFVRLRSRYELLWSARQVPPRYPARSSCSSA